MNIQSNPIGLSSGYLVKEHVRQQLLSGRKQIIWMWGGAGCGKSLQARLAFEQIEQKKIWLDIHSPPADCLQLIELCQNESGQILEQCDQPLRIFIDNAHYAQDALPDFCRWLVALSHENIKLCIISRLQPGVEFLEILAEQIMQEIPPALLNFSLDESITLCRQLKLDIDDDLIQVHQENNGLPLAVYSSLLARKEHRPQSPVIDYLPSAEWEEAQGNTLSALALYVKARRYDRFAKLFQENARHWFASGQRSKNGDVLALISEQEKDQYPWCWLWQSLLELPIDPAQAKNTADKAYHLFKQQQDINGMYLAVSHALLTYLVKLSDFYDIRTLLLELAEFDNEANYASADRHTQASASYVIYFCMFIVMPEHPHVARWEQRTLDILMADTEIVPKLKMQVLIQKAYLYRADVYKIHPLETVKEIGNQQAIEPYDVINFNLAKIQESWCSGEFERIDELYEESKRVCAENNMQANIAHTSLQVVIGYLLQGDTERAKKEIYVMLDRIPRKMTALLHHLYVLETWRQALCSEHALMLNTADQCETISEESGCTAYIGFSKIIKSYSYLLAGEYVLLRQQLTAFKQMPHMDGYEIFTFHIDLINGFLFFKEKDMAAATRYAVRAVNFAARKNLMYYIWLIPEVLAANISLALSENCQPDFCNKLINRLNLPIPQTARSENSWCWPVKIKTLGGFSSNLDGFNKSGKAPTVQLMILYLTIAHGSSGAPLDTICLELWPDEAAATARHKLDNALYRLRQLMGKDNLQIINSRIFLPSDRIWVDVTYLQLLIQQCQKMLRDAAPQVEVKEKLAEIASLDQGDFLADIFDDNFLIENFRTYLANQLASLRSESKEYFA